MEKKELFKKAIFWNRISMILGVIGVVFTAIGAVPMLFMGDKLIELYEQQNLPNIEELRNLNTLGYKVYLVCYLLITLALVVWYFVNQSKLKKEIIPSKLAYYIKIVIEAASLIYSLFTTTVGISTFVMTALVCIFPVMVIINLFKLDETKVEVE